MSKRKVFLNITIIIALSCLLIWQQQSVDSSKSDYVREILLERIEDNNMSISQGSKQKRSFERFVDSVQLYKSLIAADEISIRELAALKGRQNACLNVCTTLSMDRFLFEGQLTAEIHGDTLRFINWVPQDMSFFFLKNEIPIPMASNSIRVDTNTLNLEIMVVGQNGLFGRDTSIYGISNELCI